jgi:hypothetical protein
MYAVVSCPKCSRHRMIDSSSSSTDCPFCGRSMVTKDSVKLFENADQALVRDVLSEITGFVPEKERRPSPDLDPMSTLTFRYEHCSDTYGKVQLLADGLTEIKGSFTAEDVGSVDPRNRDRIIEMMIDGCVVTETSPGHYRSI